MKDLRRFDRDPNVVDLTDEHGEADFVIDACVDCQAITITVRICSFLPFLPLSNSVFFFA